MTVVIDANILIIYGLSDEPLHSMAHNRLSAWHKAGIPLAAPRLFRSEITAVIRKAVYQGRMPHDDGRDMLAKLLAYPVTFYDDDALLTEAYELAAKFNRPRAYDAQYLALAQRLSCEFWTADERLLNAITGRFTYIRWLGNWK